MYVCMYVHMYFAFMELTPIQHTTLTLSSVLSPYQELPQLQQVNNGDLGIVSGTPISQIVQWLL